MSPIARAMKCESRLDVRIARDIQRQRERAERSAASGTTRSLNLSLA